MAYERKTRDVYVVEVYYSKEYGFEEVYRADERQEALLVKKDYLENCAYPVRMKKKREKINFDFMEFEYE